jgi:hypothetical protein
MSGKPLPKWPILLLLSAMVIVPAMFWQRVWFGSRLSEAEIRQRLTRPENPREVQHACEQISQWMKRDPEGAHQFYDLLPPLADHADEHVRSIAAWCMGEDDSHCRAFHEVLLVLAADESPSVRFNAALGLARFGDPAARPILREMLAPFAAIARWKGPTSQGAVVDTLRPHDPVRPLTQLALVDTGQGERKPVLAPLGFISADRRFSQSERAYLETQARLTAHVIQKRTSATGRRSSVER